ncbi:MAG: hypothetical protein HYU67_12505 [Flavobacteriia bacterium]|nr:hypothetical protein [Flavobacteriia bacterium]
MKFILFLLSFCLVLTYYSQSVYKNKKSKKDYFGGAKDYRVLSNKGLMIEAGLTNTFPSKSQNVTDDISYEAQIKAKGGIGFFLGLGLAHFNVKKTTSRIGRIYHYFDYGIQFSTYHINEATEIRNKLNDGTLSTPINSQAKFYQGYLGARFSLHHLFYLGKGNRFVDFAPGIDAGYQMLTNPATYSTFTAYNAHFSPYTKVQLHLSIGFGFRLKRGSYLIPFVQAPVLGLYEFPFQALHWFSSKYYPVQIGIKWIRLFSKRKNGCTDNGTEEDRKRNQEFLQGQ